MSSVTDFLINIILPLGVTFIITWIIGFERQNIGKAAGISPHVLIALCSCGLAILQVEFAKSNPQEGHRLVAQLVTGVGFLGAGVIMKSNRTVKGLTTASTIFSCAVVGIIIGSGRYDLGVTFGVLVILFMYGRDLSRRINPFHRNNSESSEEDHHDC